MGVYTGTAGSDTLVGTDEDDIFHSSPGQDIFDGKGGRDRAIIDYSAGGTGESYGHNFQYLFGGLYAAFRGPQNARTELIGIEEIEYHGNAASDQFNIDLTQVAPTWKIYLDAGGGTGFDAVTLKLRVDSAALIGSAIGGTLSSGALTFVNFEQFYLTLGDGSDDLTLAGGNDVVDGGGGNDSFIGMGGDDQLLGMAGADILDGGDANDELYAYDKYTGVDDGAEIDTLRGGAGNDLLSFGYGDSADGGSGTDRLSISLRGGTTGAVLDLSVVFAGGTITVGGGTITGFEAYDRIYATEYADTIITGDGGVVGSFLSAGIFGFGGDDDITTGSRADTVNGGLGNDTIHAGGSGDFLSGDEGNDRVFGDGGADTIFGFIGDDELHGGSENDIIYGNEGNDQLFGDDGADTLVGAIGNDMMAGGAGDDNFTLEGTDTLVEAVGGGNDTATVGFSFMPADATHVLTAGAEIETLTAANVGAFAVTINLTGNEFGQTIIGHAGKNRLDGGGGIDTLRGGQGDDEYVVDMPGDIVVENSGEGADRIFAKSDYALAAGLSVEILSADSDAGTAALTLQGNELANRIIGNAGANLLIGGAGDDRLEGGAGNDRLIGGLGHDKMFGGSGADTFVFAATSESRHAIRSDGWKRLPDRLGDFVSGEDKIDLSALDAIEGTGANDIFTFIGAAAFSGQAGQLRFVTTSDGALILADMDGDRSADFIVATSAPTLTAVDFIL